MKRALSFLKSWAPWALLGWMLVSIVRTAIAGPGTAPRPGDVEKADRVLEQRVGEDLRVQRPEGQWVGGLGIIEPRGGELKLAPAMAGRIMALPVEEGAQVAAGDLLVELESAAEEAALAVAEAELRSAELELQRVRGSARTADVEALRREAEAARVRAAQSTATYDRIEATSGSGGVSTEELDRARRQAEQDRLAADAAESRREAATADRPLDVRVANARVDVARARRDQAAATLAMKRVVAPRAGEVLEILFDIGEFVQPGGAEPVVVMGDTSVLRARIDVDERDVDAIVRDGRAIVTVDAMPGRRFEGRIVTVARRMGRKNVRSDEPTERIDTKVLEIVVELGPADELIVGQRVMAYLEKRG